MRETRPCSGPRRGGCIPSPYNSRPAISRQSGDTNWPFVVLKQFRAHFIFPDPFEFTPFSEAPPRVSPVAFNPRSLFPYHAEFTTFQSHNIQSIRCELSRAGTGSYRLSLSSQQHHTDHADVVGWDGNRLVDGSWFCVFPPLH